ncbi:PREDICTED: mitochondrial sodium/hydrogen exchanger 9B2-like [Diuraphis noxia]|uniref:mitochondrial sodium/hydrogen exchanger 9B2-like n=1 Tax=Diuraphis noxia TaxID=143948 RepID=UPI000763AA53|nr:PREDICTED: mitochondrial sodium/hydrogen exchanger 9B2-like [Diuraphis noxia]XP_015364914.1 PREDICTED: mitochondrial sodium/hydrogen exchanger 9B2-like [Diuraphis noxia]XP_015364923.1 PREDICTED: mitochondrial sodium/hydrogen exchanger 9B2-like [Diuraphis noxia]
MGDRNGEKNGSELQHNQDDTRVQFTDSCGAAGVSGSDAAALASRCDNRLLATAANLAAAILAVAIAWTLLYVNVSPELMAMPGGSLASIFVLYVTGTVAGWLITKVGGLPPLLGMMLAGIALQNSGLYNVTGWCFHLVSTMREAALTVILIKGGLELNAGQLRRLSGVVARLTVLPCVAEAVAAGVAAHFILPNFSLVWGLTLGFTLSAVSPAVLVPSLFRLKRIGYGEVKGINTLLIAASSLDDAVSISAFGILLGVLFSNGSLTSKIIQGPIDVAIGTVVGLVWGCVLIFVPPSPWAIIYNKRENVQNAKKSEIENAVTAKRSFLLGAGGFLAVTGSQWCGYPGAGPLACIISAFVAGTGWRKRSAEHKRNNPPVSVDGVDRGNGEEKGEDDELSVVQVFEYAWTGLQPVLFAFIGTDLKFELLKRGDMIFLGLIVLAFGLMIRLIVTTCSVVGSGFSRKEILFVNIAWLPKATVQAALAPVALDIARNLGTEEDVECATRLVTIAVISILLTAPVGAFGIQLFGPKLLPRNS